jgi:putative serine protease PepD
VACDTLEIRPLFLGMRRLLLLLTALLCSLALLSPATTAQASDLSKLAEKAKRSVVHLDVLDARGRKVGVGSGFIVSTSGRIVTNHHVIDQAGGMIAVLHDGTEAPIVGVLRADEINDVAVIQASGTGFEPLTLGSSRSIQAGEEVAVIGSPVGLAGTLSAGIVSAVRAEGPKLDSEERARFSAEAWTIQITAPISPGSSGSPVIETAKGTVIAVAVGQRRDGQALNFAVPIEHAIDLLSTIGPNDEPAPFSRDVAAPAVTRNLLISGVFFGGLALLWWGLGRLRRQKSRLIPER